MDAALEQRMAALDYANEIRVARARAKRDLFAGRIALRDALELPCCRSMKVFDLLLAQRGWGGVKALKAMRVLGLPASARVGSLTAGQRAALTRGRP
jgi:hypothetical protein